MRGHRRDLFERADEVIDRAAREIALQPESSKTLRTFTMTEVCSLLDLHPTVFYELIRQHPENIPTGEKGKPSGSSPSPRSIGCRGT